MLRTPQKPITRKMNFRISGWKVTPKTCSKYVGLIIDKAKKKNNAVSVEVCDQKKEQPGGRKIIFFSKFLKVDNQ